MLNYRGYLPECKFEEFCKVMFGYCGGKKRLFNYIAFLIYMSAAETLIEPCAGAAYVSLNIEVKNKVLNDVSFSLAVIYKALSIPDIADGLLSRLKSTVYSPKVHSEAKEYWKYVNTYIDKLVEEYRKTYNNTGDDRKIRQAVKNEFLSFLNGQDLCDTAYYSWIRHSFSWLGNKLSDSFNSSVGKQEKFMHFQDGIINYYHRLDNAQVSSESVLDILERLVNNPNKISNNTVVFLDPPYLPSKEQSDKLSKSNKRSTVPNVYDCDTFTEADHKKMLELADKLPREKCKVIISGYNTDLYTQTFNRSDFGEWNCFFAKEVIVMCGNGENFELSERPKANEYLFTNFSI
ncbi:MAG: DNA adenine methylase [Ruminococcus flavefaciens]|nr:DNA adenine methylase [Ruminococcus flavefaciens]